MKTINCGWTNAEHTQKSPMAGIMLKLVWGFLAEGQQNELIVMGEKGRAQLARDRSSFIKETIADTQKVRITFSQVQLAFTLSFTLSSTSPRKSAEQDTARGEEITACLLWGWGMGWCGDTSLLSLRVLWP